MCGVLGAINIQLPEAALSLIEHRGPDGKGQIVEKVSCHHVALSHTRLAIVETSEAGAQPMRSYSENSVVSFNGEIYNHQNLRKDFPVDVFVSDSDTETLVNYLEKFGIERLSKINGIFAFAYLDKPKKKLYLVRDPFGVKPIYYAEKNNGLIFCSELAPILSVLKVDLDIPALATTLRLRYAPSPLTMIKGVKKILPGSVLEVDLSNTSLELKEWCYSKKEKTLVKRTASDALMQYGHRFEAAVERQLMSDVEVGLFLSGGVDSALVAMQAAKKTSNKMKAYTIGFDVDNARDEVAAAKETAEYIGLEHIPIEMTEKDFFDSFEEVMSVVEEPIATTSIIPFYFLCKRASQDLKVILTGQGADEPLGGYGRYRGALIAQAVPNVFSYLIPEFTSKLFEKNDTVYRGIKMLARIGDINKLLAAYETFDFQEIKRLLQVNEENAFELVSAMDANYRGGTSSLVDRMMRIDCRMNLADDLLMYTDKVSMRHSLECRVPMLDHELVGFLESLGAEHKLNLRGGKLIHKRYAENTLPPYIVNRKKLGFQSPTDVWFNSSEFVPATLLDRSNPFADHFDLREVEKILKKNRKGYNYERHIFLMLSIALWMRHNLVTHKPE